MPRIREVRRALFCCWVWPAAVLTAAVLTAAAMLCACHTQPGTRSARQVPNDRTVLAMSAGTAVATLVRPTPSLVRLSLWIDAGSRDAEPAQLATLAAWSAAERAGAAVTATVYPDATELALPCATAELERCMGQLQLALGTRTISEPQAQAERVRLAEGRRLALAADPERSADALALHALLGDGARGFFPLGAAQDDSAASARATSAFLAAHYGPSRALLLAAGDADAAVVRDAVAHSFSHLPPATQARALRAWTASAESQLEVESSDRTMLAVALAASDLPTARASVDELQRALDATGSPVRDLRLSASVFEARGTALAILRIRGADAESMLTRVTAELARLQLEAPTPARQSAAPDDLATLSQTFALAWAARATPMTAALHFGVGMLIDGGRADRPKLRDPDGVERARRLQSLQEKFARALASAHPNLRGSIDEQAASVVTDNGARIEVQHTSGELVAVAVRSAFGAEQDPPALHGRGALLATLTSTACAGMGPGRLTGELQRLKATLTPLVDAESYGVLLQLPAAQWREGLDLSLRCMKAPSHQASHLADAALRLQSRLAATTSALALRAQVAALIAPRAPGLCAPWGHPGRVGNLSLQTLLDALPQALNGAAWAVAVAGPVPVNDAATRIARRVATLPVLPLPGAAQPGEILTAGTAPADLLAPSSEGSDVLIVWHARGTARAAVAARVVSTALSAVLARLPGVLVLWHDGDSQRWGAWAAVAAHLPAATIEQLPALLRDASQHLDATTLEAALRAANEIEHTQDTQAQSRLGTRVARLTRQRLGLQSAAASAADGVAVQRALLQAIPIWANLD